MLAGLNLTRLVLGRLPQALVSRRAASTGTMAASLEFFKRAKGFGDRTAVVDEQGAHSYNHLLAHSASLSHKLVQSASDVSQTSNGFPVVFLCPRDSSYIITQWAIWQAGGMAVPLCDSHPPAEWNYYIKDSQAALIVAHRSFTDKLEPLAKEAGIPFLLLDDNSFKRSISLHPQTLRKRTENAILIYTSGTTGNPKGVLYTHEMLKNQITSLICAWEWSANDRIVQVLPPHHVHGIVNTLMCALWSGGVCDMKPRFTASEVWSEMTGLDATQWSPSLNGPPPTFTPAAVAVPSPKAANIFMAVPTMYYKLIEYFDEHVGGNKELTALIRDACKRNMRLMVAGSAPLPMTIMNRWEDITGHMLLERYGMTEIGMALSNSYRGKRYPGCVGFPLPGVEARIVTKEERHDGWIDVPNGVPGNLWIRGSSVFKQYWCKPIATEKAFYDGWFMTGDEAVCNNGIYKLLGRTSSDIIKTGGFKVSALEIENVILNHSSVSEIAVVGVDDMKWGQKVAAAISFKPGKTLTLTELRTFCKDYLAPYK
eukprot:Ihof_evm2s507 gene=Ihof_evmTU2s507